MKGRFQNSCEIINMERADANFGVLRFKKIINKCLIILSVLLLIKINEWESKKNNVDEYKIRIHSLFQKTFNTEYIYQFV